MYTIRKQFEFEMAHILDSSVSKECQRVHGHSYILEVILSSKLLNKDGMVIDFKALGNIVKMNILGDVDHALVLNSKGPWATEFGHLSDSVKWVKYNPTAENMAKNFSDILVGPIIKRVPTMVQLTIRLHETRTGWAEYKLQGKLYDKNSI